MQGSQGYQPQLFSVIQLESFVPTHHLLRKVEAVFDLTFVRKLTEPFYCENNGRPSVDPELFFRMLLVGYFYGISSDRRLCEEIGYNLVYRWFCRLNLEYSVPDHSTLTRIRDRFGENVFKTLFDQVIERCRSSGLLKGERIILDG